MAAYVASQKAQTLPLLGAAANRLRGRGAIREELLERPGLQRELLADIDAGLVEQIVVYKVDRLTLFPLRLCKARRPARRGQHWVWSR